MFTPGQSFTFGSLNFIVNEACRLYTSPPPTPILTLFVKSLEFINDHYGEILLRVPPLLRALDPTPEHVLEPASAALVLALVSKKEQFEDSTPNLIPEARTIAPASRLRRCADTTSTLQPTPTSHVVAMVRMTCPLLDVHKPGHYVWGGHFSDDDDNSGSCPPTTSLEGDGSPTAIALEQVIMVVPGGATNEGQTIENTTSSTNANPDAPAIPDPAEEAPSKAAL